MLKINMEVLEKEYCKYTEIAGAYLWDDAITKEGELSLWICLALEDLMQLHPLVGTICDEQTLGEFTRRSELAIEDLKKLGYDVTILEA